MKIQTNVVFEHLANSKKKIIIQQGGTRSGKTYNSLLWIIASYCSQNRKKIITICRKTFPSLRATVMRDFFEILKAQKLYFEFNHNKSNHEYRLFGNLVEFISLDQPVKIRGRKRDLLFINEANELFFEDWQQLIFRTNGRIILDFNPSEEHHWIYEKVIPREDSDFFITTYKDNPFLEKSIIQEIERLKETDLDYWKIYGLGQRTKTKGVIFNFSECLKIPETASLVSYGMDFGYTNDPTTLIAVFKDNHSLFVKEFLYRTMMTLSDIVSFLKTLYIERTPIYADSAEPRLIEEIRRAGFNIRPSVKGKDSINAGIDLLKRYKIHIHKDSTNTIREFRNYKWMTDKAGKTLNKAQEGNDHCIDAIRYACYSILSNVNFGKYVLR
jgi:phage terminase large subunit